MQTCPTPVWPEAVAPSLARDLARRYPEARIVWNVAQRHWQVYEDRSGQWAAERLHTAICNRYKHDGDATWEWWRHPHAPWLVDNLPMRPGEWVLEWLGRADLRRIGGARQWQREFEERDRRWREQAKQRRHEFNKEAMLSGAYRHLRDALDGDPLAGHRKWVHTVPKEVIP